MKELWLEYGFLHENNYRDVCWYNEGRWQEIVHFLVALWRWRSKSHVYFLWRWGQRNHFIRGNKRAPFEV
jgi:hypothetical protein